MQNNRYSHFIYFIVKAFVSTKFPQQNDSHWLLTYFSGQNFLFGRMLKCKNDLHFCVSSASCFFSFSQSLTMISCQRLFSVAPRHSSFSTCNFCYENLTINYSIIVERRFFRTPSSSAPPPFSLSTFYSLSISLSWFDGWCERRKLEQVWKGWISIHECPRQFRG